MGPMPRATTQRHPPDQLIHAIRAALLSTIRAECPEVLDDLRDAVFTPLIHSGTPRGDIVALLKRRAPHPVDIHRGSLHRQVRAQIVRWARRWHLNAPWICDEAWRTLSWWARWARDSRPAGQGLLSTIWAEWPEVLDDLRDAVFTPLIHSGTPRRDIVALLKRRDPRPVDMPRGSLHRQVRAQIVRWARRWHINAPWIRDEAWRTLSWWVRSARDSRPAGQGLLSTIWAEWPEVLVDLRDAVFTPLIHSGTPRGDIVALLKRRAPHPVDIHRGSLHRQVRAQIVRWARRWHLNAPGIRDEAWRTLSWWARWARDARPAGRVFGWAPLVDTTPRPIAPIEPCPPRIPPSAPLVSTTPRSIAPPTPKLLRPRDGVALIWFVRHRVWPTPASLEDLANGVTDRGYVTPHAVRVAVNYLAHELDLPVRRRGRPRAARSRAPSPRA